MPTRARLFAAIITIGLTHSVFAEVNPVATPPSFDDGRVVSVTGPESVNAGEILRNISIQFAAVQQPKTVSVRWTDSLDRLCGVFDYTIQPPEMSLNVEIPMQNAIGFVHRLDVYINGERSPWSHKFRVIPKRSDWVDYAACVWANYPSGYAERLREYGVNGTIGVTQSVIDSNLDFYVDNIAWEVFAYYHKNRDEHEMMKDLWANKPYQTNINHRRWSLTCPGSYEQVRYKMKGRVEAARDYAPLFYNVADEIGIADQSAVSDMDWEYTSRDAWTAWLKKRYGSLDKLNAQWETTYPSWDRVRAFYPNTNVLFDQLWRDCLLPKKYKTITEFNQTYQTKYESFADVVKAYASIKTGNDGMSDAGLRERFKNVHVLNNALGTEFATMDDAVKYVLDFETALSRFDSSDTRGWNLSWWCDFREYMDDYLADGLKKGCDIGREYDPNGRFGITGTHHPGVFSGHNYEKLIKAVDYIMPYNIGQSFELIRGLAPQGYPYMNPTWQTGTKLQYDLWHHFLMGSRGVLFWDNDEPNNKFFDKATGEPTDRARAAQPVLNEITGGLDRLLLQSKRVHDGIAIYHSMPSIRVEWMHRNIGLGRHYIERMSWNEYGECEASVLRTSWIRLIEDNNLQYIFVTPDQVAAGRLQDEGITCLILPEVWALSDQDADNIRAFAERGGKVIADQFTGLYDEHGKRRERGILDDFFGIDQSDVFGDDRGLPNDRQLERVPPVALTLSETLSDLLPKGMDVNGLTTRPRSRYCEARGTKVVEANGIRALATGTRRLAGNQTETVGALVVNGMIRNPVEVNRVITLGKHTFQAAPYYSAPKIKSVFLGLDMSHYSRLRISDPEKAEKVLLALNAFFHLPKQEYPSYTVSDIRVTHPTTNRGIPCTEVNTWSHDIQPDYFYKNNPYNRKWFYRQSAISILRNYNFRKEGIGGDSFVDNSMFEKEEPVKVQLAVPYYVINQRTGEDYGQTDSVTLTLKPFEPIILTLQSSPFELFSVSHISSDGKSLATLPVPPKPDTPALTTETPAGDKTAISTAPETVEPSTAKRGETITLRIASPENDILNVFRVEAIDPTGKLVRHYTQTVSSATGTSDYAIPTALNDLRGMWQFNVTDVATRKRVTFPIRLTGE
ncbi:MAG: hypothetical protein ABIH86_06210 [Planctomycetota bacterium]